MTCRPLIVRIWAAGIVWLAWAPASAEGSAKQQYQAGKRALAQCGQERGDSARRACYDAAIGQLVQGDAYHWTHWRTPVRRSSLGDIVRFWSNPLRGILFPRPGSIRIGDAVSITNRSAAATGSLFAGKSDYSLRIGCHPKGNLNGVFLLGTTAPWDRDPRVAITFVRDSGSTYRWPLGVTFEEKRRGRPQRYMYAKLASNGSLRNFLRELRKSQRLVLLFTQPDGRHSTLQFEIGGIRDAILPVLRHCNWGEGVNDTRGKPDLTFAALSRLTKSWLPCRRIADAWVRLYCYDLRAAGGRGRLRREVGRWAQELSVKGGPSAFWLFLGGAPTKVEGTKGLSGASIARMTVSCTTSRTGITFLGVGVQSKDMQVRYKSNGSRFRPLPYMRSPNAFNSSAAIRDSRSAVKFLRSLSRRKRLVIEFSNTTARYGRGWRRMTFDLRGFNRAMKPLRQYCRI